MRYLLSLLPISRREADHSAARVADVLAEMSWAEMIKTTLVTIMAMVLIPSLLLVLSVSDQWV